MPRRKDPAQTPQLQRPGRWRVGAGVAGLLVAVAAIVFLGRGQRTDAAAHGGRGTSGARDYNPPASARTVAAALQNSRKFDGFQPGLPGKGQSFGPQVAWTGGQTGKFV